MIKKDLKGIAIHCSTEETAVKCCNLAFNMGWKWKNGEYYPAYHKDNKLTERGYIHNTGTYWDEYQDKTCYDFYNGILLNAKYCIHNNIEIKSAEWFIENFSPKKKIKSKNIESYDKVLVRDKKSENWKLDIFLSYNSAEEYPYECINFTYKQCISYIGNEHLLKK